MRYVIFPWIGLLLFSQSALAEDATSCVQRYTVDTAQTLKNTCTRSIAVFWCHNSSDPDLLGGKCGSQPFYRRNKLLQPNATYSSKDLPTGANITLGACYGNYSSYTFTNDSGGFSCKLTEQPKAVAITKSPTDMTSDADCQRVSSSKCQPIAVPLTPIKATVKAQTTKKPVPPSKAQCVELFKYRDTKLATDLERVSKQYQAATKILAYLAPIKRESAELRMKNVAVDVAYKLTLTLKTAADAIGDILLLLPSNGAALKGAKGFSEFILRASDVVDSSSIQVEMAQEANFLPNTSKYMATELARKIPGIGDALMAAYHLADNVKSLKDANEEGSKILDILDQNISSLEKIILQREALLKSSSFKIEMINKEKNDIDKICHHGL